MDSGWSSSTLRPEKPVLYIELMYVWSTLTYRGKTSTPGQRGNEGNRDLCNLWCTPPWDKVRDNMKFMYKLKVKDRIRELCRITLERTGQHPPKKGASLVSKIERAPKGQ